MRARVNTRCLIAPPIALLIALAPVPVPLRAQAPRIFTELDTAFVSIGDRMAFTVRVEHDPAAIVVWPDSIGLGSVEVLGAETVRPISEGGRSITGQRFTLAAFELGDLEIPSFEIRVEAPDGSSTTLSTDAYVITVQSVGLDEGGDIRAIRGPLGIPFGVIYLLLWILLLLLLAGLGYWLWARRGPAEDSPRRSVVIPRFPHEDAYEALARLEASDLLGRGEIKEYHILASEIIRTYIEGQFSVYALEMTTGEVMEGLRRADLPEDDVAAFEEFARRCDLVKFAKLWPAPDACRDLLEAARAFVAQTHPRMDDLDENGDPAGGAGTGGWDTEGGQDDEGSEDDQGSKDDEALAPAHTLLHDEGG